MRLNKQWYWDKVYACWLGKNIGGTLGGPYESKKEVLNVTGFTTEPGTPLPNDDLDLQLVWLFALEKQGVAAMSQNLLAEYWIDWISPHWNEYGLAKENLKQGILPPMSGELDNEHWKNSNGAWIRSEIWASVAPGCPDIAMKYAAMDAMVDHGISEGTYAEMFTAALESAAYFESDIEKLVRLALGKIPAESRMAKAINLVLDGWKNGKDYIDVRNELVEQSKDIGWFQAPANVGFAVIGLLYGEGDFKKSCLYAINCGDDTDCTGATVGAVLGIIGGTAGIPEDWKAYIGDRILSIAINGQYQMFMPKTCTELTDRVLKLVPQMMEYHKIPFEFYEGENETDDLKEFSEKSADEILWLHNGYSYEILNAAQLKVRVEYRETPKVVAGDIRHLKLTFEDIWEDAKRVKLRLLLPDGWGTSGYRKSLYLEPFWNQPKEGFPIEFDIIVGDQLQAINRVYMEVTSPCMVQPMMIPIVFVG